MTTLDYLQAQAVTVAWNAGNSHGLNAMVAILHCLRNQADAAGEWSLTLDLTQYDAALSYKQGLPNVRHPDFQSLLKIAPQIITDLSQPLARVVDRHFYLNFSETPPSTGGSLNVGNLFFF